MDPITVTVIAALVLAFASASRRLEHGVVTGPMAFVLFGFVLGPAVAGWIHGGSENGVIHWLAETTLILVLFGDAARIDFRALRTEYTVPLRMLLLGLPGTVVLGTLAALLVFPDLGIFDAALLAAVLAPTDAALGQAVVSHPTVPARIRQSLNVESGINDGIALPVVLIFAATAEAVTELDLAGQLAHAALQLGIAPLVGVAVGFGGGKALDSLVRAEWIDSDFQKIAGLALAFLAFGASELAGGNGFIAAFVAGLAMGNTTRDACSSVYDFMETEGHLLILVTFLVFGAVLLPQAEFTGATLGYALLSLTVVRMVPVALSLLGLGLQPITLAFLGWFGPRGLASILFALLVVERMGIAAREEILGAVIVTVAASVVLHGLSAFPLAEAFGRRMARTSTPSCPERQPAPALRARIVGRAPPPGH